MMLNQFRPGDLKEQFNGGRVVVDDEMPHAHTVVSLYVSLQGAVFAYVFDHFNGEQFLTKYDSFGVRDDSYGEDGRLHIGYGQVSFDGQARALHYTLESESIMSIRRYRVDGVADHAFGEDGVCRVDISEVGGRFPQALVCAPSALGMAAASGNRAPSYGWVQLVAGEREIYLVTGASFDQGTDYYTLAARITDEGRLDNAFGIGGFFVYRSSSAHVNYPRGIAIDKALSQLLILVFEPNSALGDAAGVIRLTRAGALDTGFNTSKIEGVISNILQGPVLDAANTFKVVAALREGEHLFGFKQAGEVDGNFNNGRPLKLTAPDHEMEYFYALSTHGEDEDYRIVHLGYSEQAAAISRLLADGRADSAFGNQGTAKFERQPESWLPTPLLSCTLNNNEVVFAVGHELFWVLG